MKASGNLMAPGALIAVTIVCAFGLVSCGQRDAPATLPSRDDASGGTAMQPVRNIEAEVAALIEERRKLDASVWAREVAAQKHEQTIVKYWDQMLRPEDDKFAVLATFPLESITLDTAGESSELDWGIRRISSGGPGETLDQEGWRLYLDRKKRDGYAIDGIEFHQSAFDVNARGQAESVFDVLLNVIHLDRQQRLNIRTKLRVEWTGELDDEGLYVPGALTLHDTIILARNGPDVFDHRILNPRIKKTSHPVAFDLNRDGLSEILLANDNLVYWNRGEGQFESRPLFMAPGVAPPSYIRTATVADFDGDGYVDLLCTGFYATAPRRERAPQRMGVFLFRGNAEGQFVKPGEQAASSALSLKRPHCLTAGDIDGDGDLDVWLAQYKSPYVKGQMPTPFYNANDGYPSYLLLNRGDGYFLDKTESAGLAPKRFRRTYAASFIDLDNDRDLDLIVSADFAGTDIYYNDGTGHFTDKTESALDEASIFGMAHTFADYNRDGAIDCYVIGMGSTTMRRLNHMGLNREDRPEYLEMRTRMGYGNRMYLSRGDGSFSQPEYKDSIARSGWAWGTTSFDFDNDGDMDIYVANGHQSGQTTKDYCTTFWTHDVYTGGSQSDEVIRGLFYKTFREVMSYDHLSWDGFQKNHLFMNQSGKGFVNVGFLMNVALIQDCHALLSDDFDGDGRPDLLVASKNIDWATKRQWDTLHLLINQWPEQNNWIGVRLQIAPGGPSSIGAVIRVRSESGEQIAHIVTGDSYRAQHAPMKHFGIGLDSSVEEISVRWPDGTADTVQNPEINAYYTISPASSKRGAGEAE